MPSPVPGNETARVEALARYQVLDTPPDFALDALTELAAEICHCPVALISMVDDRRQWFKSKYGLPADFTECPREMTVCSSTICANDLLYVPDLTKDERFKDIGTVKSEPHLRFYCGMPLINQEGYALGTLCVVDFEPRELSPSQREAVRHLAQQTMAQLELRRQLLERDTLLRELASAREQADEEKRKSEELLLNLFPAAIAEELKLNGRVQPRYHDAATILFADFKDFAHLSEGLEPAQLIDKLNQHFAHFDEIAAANRLETIKTIGDAYMCAGGIPLGNRTHPLDAALGALQIQKYLANDNRQRERLRLPPWHLRIGINTGPLIAGVAGNRHLTYDIWGNAVNLAERLEQLCEPGGVVISASTCHYIGELFETEARGNVEVKHMGSTDVFALYRLRPEYAADTEGTQPNAAFWDHCGHSPAAPTAL